MIKQDFIKPTISFNKNCHYKDYKLGEVLDRVTDPLDPKDDEFYCEIGIKSHGKGIFYKPLTTKHDIGDKRVFWVKKDLLILNVVFAWEQAVAKTTENDVGKIASHRFPMFKPKPAFLDLDYILYFFLTDLGKKLLGIASPGGAGRNKTLGQKAFDRLSINLPPIDEQKKIADFVGAVDKKIQILETELDTLLSFKKAMLQNFIGDNRKEPKWPSVPLKSILTEKKEKNFNALFSRTEVLSVSGKYGVVNQVKHLGRSYAGESILDYNVVDQYDIVYTRSPLKNNPYGIIKSNKGQPGVVSKLYAVFECKNSTTSTFIENYFELDVNANRYLRPLVHKGAKNSMNISKRRFLSGYIE